MSTRLYEGMFLFDANLAGKDWTALEKHVEELCKKHSCEMVHNERWPDRKLAYEIKGCKKGTYYLTYFRAAPTAIVGLERDCQLSDRILRVLVVQEEFMEEILAKRLAKQEPSTEESSDGDKSAPEAAKATPEAEAPAAPAAEAAADEPAAPESTEAESAS